MLVRDFELAQLAEEWNVCIRDQVKLCKKRGIPSDIKHKSRRMITMLNKRIQNLPEIDDFELIQIVTEWRVALKQAHKTLKHMLTQVVTKQSLEDTQQVINILEERIQYYGAHLK